MEMWAWSDESSGAVALCAVEEGYGLAVHKNPIPPFNDDVLQSIADVLGETTDGLTGSEIERILAEIRVSDVDPMQTKRYRLFDALAAQQNKDEVGDWSGWYRPHSLILLTLNFNHDK